MANVNADMLRTAAEWLDAYDSDGADNNEAECRAVAEWLRNEADKRDTSAAARQIAKKTGVSTQYAKKRLLEVIGEGRKI